MSLTPCEFDRSAVQTTGEEPVYNGFFRFVRRTLRHRLFRGGWGPEITREVLVKPAAAGAIPYDPWRDQIGLVEQFRPGLMADACPWTLEGVAGMLDAKDEAPEAMIGRELWEEAGLKAEALLPVTRFYPLPGSCDELVHVYIAICDLSAGGGLFGLEHEGEDIRFSVVPADDVFAAMLTDRTNNATTLIGLMWLERERERIRAEYGGAAEKLP